MALGINIGVIALFAVMGVVFLRGKGADLISGYNTLPEDQKQALDEKALCKCMAKMMFALAGCWLVLTLGLELGQMWLFWVGFGLFLAVIAGFLVYMNTGKRFHKQSRQGEEKD